MKLGERAGRFTLQRLKMYAASSTHQGGMNDKTCFSRSGYRRQFPQHCRRPIHAPRAARTGPGQSDNSGRWRLWSWLSPRPIWRLPPQWLLRRRVLRRRCSARRGGSARCGGNSARRSGSPAGRRAFVPPLQRVPMLVCLLTELRESGLLPLADCRRGESRRIMGPCGSFLLPAVMARTSPRERQR
jgi:hypothetical protein